MKPTTLLALATGMMSAAIVLFTSAFLAAFVYPDVVPLPLQVLAHICIMLSAIMLKLGYVIRLAGKRQLTFGPAHSACTGSRSSTTAPPDTCLLPCKGV